MPKITKRLIDKPDTLRPNPSGKDKFIWDSDDGALKGFGIRVKPSGIASYLVQYRNKEGRTRRLVIGKVGTLTPEEARGEARTKLAAVDKGGDPSAERHAAREAMTVSELCDFYLREGTGHVKNSTIAGDRSRIESHVKPLLGRRVAKGLTVGDLEKFQADIAAGKTAKPRQEKGRGGHTTGGKSAAARTLATLSIILEFGRRRKIVDENPVKDVQKFSYNKRERFLSIEELGLLGRAIREAENEGVSKIGLAVIRALLLTGCRKNEIMGLPWAWLDAKANCIRFEDTKTGPQVRPISSIAADFLLSRKKGNNSKWVFPSDITDGHFIGLPRLLKKLCNKAGLEKVIVHTLRHTFASTARAMEFSEFTIAGLIGQQVSGVTARYAHATDSALVSAADRVSARIAAALDGKKQNTKIIPFRNAGF